MTETSPQQIQSEDSFKRRDSSAADTIRSLIAAPTIRRKRTEISPSPERRPAAESDDIEDQQLLMKYPTEIVKLPQEGEHSRSTSIKRFNTMIRSMKK